MIKQYGLIGLLITSFLTADQIKIYNSTPCDWYIASYYTEDPICIATPPVHLPGKKLLVLERPSTRDGVSMLSSYCDTSLVISTDKESLKQNLERQELNNLFWSNIGRIWGSSFYLARKGDQLRLYTKLGYYLRDPVGFVSNALEDGFLKINEYIREHLNTYLSQEKEDPYKHLTAYRCTSAAMGYDEHLYLIQRQQKVKQALQTLIEIPVITVPRISIVCSGGKQALLATLGWLNGLQKIGLLDCCTYISSLSTSSLVVVPWISTGYTCAELKRYLRAALTNEDALSSLALKLIGSSLLKKVSYGHPITFTDLYGSLLANTLLQFFGNKRQKIFLHEQIHHIESGQMPFPLYTALEYTHSEYLELNPFEVSLPSQQIAIPTWAFGKKFQGGQSVDFSSACSLASILGILSSSYVSKFSAVYDDLLRALPVSLPIRSIKNNCQACSILPNFTEQDQHDPFLHLTDPAPHSQLAYHPLLQKKAARSSDVLIVLDASDGRDNALEQMERYAKKEGRAFPALNNVAHDKSVIIIDDKDDQDATLIIYCRLGKSAHATDDTVLPFVYSEEYFDALVSTTEKDIIDSSDTIINAITWYIDRRNRLLS